eukprot:363374-Chlamydomonas_euryale.AAC.3
MLPRPDKRMGEAGCPQSLRDGQIIVPVHMQHRYVKVLRDVVVFEFGLLIWDAVLFERLRACSGGAGHMSRSFQRAFGVSAVARSICIPRSLSASASGLKNSDKGAV